MVFSAVVFVCPSLLPRRSSHARSNHLPSLLRTRVSVVSEGCQFFRSEWLGFLPGPSPPMGGTGMGKDHWSDLEPKAMEKFLASFFYIWRKFSLWIPEWRPPGDWFSKKWDSDQFSIYLGGGFQPATGSFCPAPYPFSIDEVNFFLQPLKRTAQQYPLSSTVALWCNNCENAQILVQFSFSCVKLFWHFGIISFFFGFWVDRFQPVRNGSSSIAVGTRLEFAFGGTMQVV